MSYGCHKRQPYTQTLRVQSGWFEGISTRQPKMTDIPFRMKENCQYPSTDLGKADAACDGCKWRVIAANPIP